MTVQRQDGLNVALVAAQPFPLAPAGVTAQVLTTEQRSGGTHQVLTFPAGWQSADSGYLTCGQDIYVLEGDLSIGDARLVTGSYMYIPAGVHQGHVASDGGCRALTIFNGRWEFVVSDASAPQAKAGELIGPVATWTLPWLDPMKEVVKKSTWTDPQTGRSARPPGVLTKTLRHNTGPKDREMVALTALAPGYVDPGTEHHPHDECLYLVAGDCYIGLTYDMKNVERREDVVLARDHFLARPPGIKHGPVCTQSGALWLLYMNDRYTGLFEDVADWRERVGAYLSSASFR